MRWRLLEYVDGDQRVLSDWSLQSVQRARLDQRLDMVRSVGLSLPPNLVAGPGIDGERHIYKFKVKGNVQLRPLLCRGPQDGRTELTFLARAIERDDILEPAGVAAVAERRRIEVSLDSRKRVALYDDEDD